MTGRRSTVLVVDDDDGGRYLKTHLLLKAGYAVSEAASGQAALDHCNNAAPEMVLLDTRLPDVHGFDICHEIKAAHPDIIVLQTSAAITSAQERALALDGGADAFLIEPIEPEELLAIVRALLRMRGAEQALRRLNDTLEELVVERTQELRDTYQRLETEIAGRRQAEEALWHTQKLEAVGQLTGGIAHDFNNLLMVIVGSIEMIRKTLQEQRVAPPGKLLRLLRTAETATDRGTELTQQLLAFARRGALRSEIVRLDEIIQALEPLLARALGESVALRLTVLPDLWACRIDPSRFESAILNLAVNARDAMPAGGELNVTVGNATIAPGAAGNPPGVPPGSYISIRVADTGRGMEADIAAHVFEPFFTTKDVGKGTGLGLSQVYGFVRQSDGHIVLDTKPGAGTAFTLYLPRCEQADPAASITDESPRTQPTGSETVLIVEDNPEVLELAVAAISDLGYRVITAGNGPAALEILHREPHVDLLFSDIVLPGGMDGFELVRKARLIRGGLKVLMTSGYANTDRPHQQRPNVSVLQKPYRLAELADQVRFALDRL
ncbi:MAG TPA: response regulator [Acetobacteraceae bacterium]